MQNFFLKTWALNKLCLLKEVGINIYSHCIENLRNFSNKAFTIRLQFIKSYAKFFVLKKRYDQRVAKLRRNRGKKVRILFPLSNSTKWKVQSLYELLSKSIYYEPIVALTLMDIENDLPREEQEAWINSLKTFLAEKGCTFVVAYDIKTGEFKSFKEFSPDIVWYTQPWRIHKIQSPKRVSRYALTCYTPYYLQSYGCLDMECDIFFMRALWRNFAMNEAWAAVCNSYQGKMRAGEAIGLGHPMLDLFSIDKAANVNREYIIYAPHWSCDTGERFSTFLKNGQQILDFAKRHPEFKWAFKPHPSLYYTLLNIVGWPKEKIDAYYYEWEHIGEAWYEGSYVELFSKSRLMITDCASFLVEYPCTRMPIIRLVSSNSKYDVHPISANLFASYYQAHNWDEFVNHFNKVVIENDDYKQEERLAAVKNMRLLDTSAAENIVNYLNTVLNIPAIN